MSDQKMIACKQCKRMTLHITPNTSHVLHLLLSVITLGVWIPIWLLVGVSNSSQAQCTICGKTKGIF